MADNPMTQPLSQRLEARIKGIEQQMDILSIAPEMMPPWHDYFLFKEASDLAKRVEEAPVRTVFDVGGDGLRSHVLLPDSMAGKTVALLTLEEP